MDVVYFLKEEQLRLTKALENIQEAKKITSLRESFAELNTDLCAFLLLELDYVYPELEGLFSGSETLIDTLSAQNRTIVRKVKGLEKLLVKAGGSVPEISLKISALAETVVGHFDAVKLNILPKMRILIRTEDREDLGDAFLDQVEELRKTERSTPKRLMSKKRA